jgi:hypothetical protein
MGLVFRISYSAVFSGMPAGSANAVTHASQAASLFVLLHESWVHIQEEHPLAALRLLISKIDPMTF